MCVLAKKVKVTARNENVEWVLSTLIGLFIFVIRYVVKAPNSKSAGRRHDKKCEFEIGCYDK